MKVSLFTPNLNAAGMNITVSHATSHATAVAMQAQDRDEMIETGRLMIEMGLSNDREE